MRTGTDPDLESIQSQLAEITATTEDGDHLVQMDHLDFIRSDGTIVTAQQASAYLSTGEWEGSHRCADLPDCVRPEHVTTVADPMSETEIDQLVSRASRPTLAQLYKQARGKGLVPASPTGYF